MNAPDRSLETARTHLPVSYAGLLGWGPGRWALFVVHATATVAYLGWRAWFTLNLADPLVGVFSAIFLLAEVALAWFAFTFHAHLSGGSARVEPPPPLRGADVDVLIPTYNEDVDLVRRTAVAARDMDFPCNVWICDDGRRPEMKALAVEIGVGYRIRANNEHFKAGNLNAALAVCEAEFVLILDADHVPRRQMLSRMIGYFADPRVGFVQTPQVYFNFESFQHAIDWEHGRMYHENSLFQHDVQAGSDRFGAAFFVGTGCLFRRSAIEEAGGIAVGTITEDIHTAMKIHRLGWRSVFLDEALAYLAGPEAPLAFVQQRLRWAQGAMQILRKDNPLVGRGLGPWQRIAYLNALAGWLSGVAQLVLWVTPAIFLLTGLSPIHLDSSVALVVVGAKVAFDIGLYALLAYPQGRLLISDCYRLTVAPLAAMASLTLLKPDGLKFKVTPKGRQAGLPTSTLATLVGMALFNLVAVGFGIDGIASGLVDPWLGAMLTGFTLYFAIVALYALAFAVERKSSTGELLVPVNLPATVDDAALADADVRVARLDAAVAWIRSDVEVAEWSVVRTEVPTEQGALPISMRVLFAAEVDGAWVAKAHLEPLAPLDRDDLEAFLFDQAIPGFLATFDIGPRVHDKRPDPEPGVASYRDFLQLQTRLT